MAFQGYVATGFTFAFDQISFAAVVSRSSRSQSHSHIGARCHPRSERRELDSWNRALGASVAALARGRFLSAALTVPVVPANSLIMVRLMRCGAALSPSLIS